MGFIQRRDEETEREYIEGVEVIERGQGPDPDFDPSSLSSSAAQRASQVDTVDEADESETPFASRRTPLRVAIPIIAAIIFTIIGYVVGSGALVPKGTGSAVVTESQLDTPVASWSYNGQRHDITAREAIETQYAIENAPKDEDGAYTVPGAEALIAYVRNEILVSEAESRGISVTDEEALEYAEGSIGISDYATMAEQYLLTEDMAKEVVRKNALVKKLYEQIVPEEEGAVAMPEAPAEPEGGDTSASSKEYADYIIDLAGNEWDAEKGTWASEDGAYREALADAEFTGESATYEQAQTAYYVAYGQYIEDAQGDQEAWTDFVNGLYAKAGIELYGLYV